MSICRWTRHDSRVRALALFCGAGGLEFGAEAAGVTVIFANDKLVEAEETFATWFPGARFERGPIERIVKFPSADLVLAGYPCQSFSMGGARRPATDPRTNLYLELGRCLDQVQPRFFLAENVPGLRGLDARRWLWHQHDRFSMAGERGYNVSVAVIKSEEYGVPQRRRRVFFVGVRRDLQQWYHFPEPSHRGFFSRDSSLPRTVGHGELIRHLPLWPEGEFYARPGEAKGEWPWYYVSRNRKARWDDPSYTVLANGRHVTLHPGSSEMELEWSNLADGSKQRWRFTGRFEHLASDPSRPTLSRPRRLSWRECALLQTFRPDFEPPGSLMRKYELIGNAVPPRLSKVLLEPLVNGAALKENQPSDLERLFCPPRPREEPQAAHPAAP